MQALALSFAVWEINLKLQWWGSAELVPDDVTSALASHFCGVFSEQILQTESQPAGRRA